jgi:hypothetical protein
VGTADFKLLKSAFLQVFDGPQPLPVLACLVRHLFSFPDAGSRSLRSPK